MVPPNAWVREEHVDRLWSVFGPGYDTYANTHTALFGFPLGHPERLCDVVPDPILGGNRVVARADIDAEAVTRKIRLTW